MVTFAVSGPLIGLVLRGTRKRSTSLPGAFAVDGATATVESLLPAPWCFSTTVPSQYPNTNATNIPTMPVALLIATSSRKERGRSHADSAEARRAEPEQHSKDSKRG